MMRRVIKNKLLLLARYLWENTDQNHTASVADIADYLEKNGAGKITRATVYNDIKTLQEFGIPVEKYKGTQNHYWISERVFSEAELQLLVDAVQAARFITRKRSSEIIDKLSRFTNDNSEVLNRKLLLGALPKSTNENILFSVNELQYAINHKRKVTFRYVDYAPNKKKVFRHDGQLYSVSPFSILWNGDNYYMIGWSDSHGKIACFRVNRMVQTTATDILGVTKPKDYKEKKLL